MKKYLEIPENPTKEYKRRGCTSTFNADGLSLGHSANYSEHCTLSQSRPPTNRSKCAGFDYVMTPEGVRPGVGAHQLSYRWGLEIQLMSLCICVHSIHE